MTGDHTALAGRLIRFNGKASAFSLIELLVVMVMITLMAALMLPALSKAKQQTSSATCLNNQKQLAYAFHMYAQDNSERIVQMADYDTGDVIWPAGGFWSGPRLAPGSWNGSVEALDSVQTALQTSNAFYFYCEAVETYHCPSDRRFLNRPSLHACNGWAYDSYARTQNLGGDPVDDFLGAGGTYTRLSAIAAPGTTFAMLETADWRGYNNGTWRVNWMGDSFEWKSPLPLWHLNVDSIAFADSHAELHKWSDTGLISVGRSAARGSQELNWDGPTNGADYLFVYKGYQFPGHP